MVENTESFEDIKETIFWADGLDDRKRLMA